MLGGSTRKGYATSVGRQSRQRLCSEFRLRQGFRLRQNACTVQKRRRPEGQGSRAVNIQTDLAFQETDLQFASLFLYAAI